MLSEEVGWGFQGAQSISSAQYLECGISGRKGSCQQGRGPGGLWGLGLSDPALCPQDIGSTHGAASGSPE